MSGDGEGRQRRGPRYFIVATPGTVGVRREGLKASRGQQLRLTLGGARRGEIREFTWKARVRLLKAMAERPWHELTGEMAMITLTYGRAWPRDGRVTKQHLKTFREAWQRKWGSCRAFWGLEFQDRGAPHFHLYAELPGVSADEFDLWAKDLWYRIVGSGDSRHLARGVHVRRGVLAGRGKVGEGTDRERVARRENAGEVAEYMFGHAAKWGQKVVPEDFHHVGKWYGFWGLDAVRHEEEVTEEVARRLLELVREEQAAQGRVVKKSQRGDGLDGAWALTPDGLSKAVRMLRELAQEHGDV